LKVINGHISEYIKEVCFDIWERYEIQFIEVGTDEDHIHFLIQSVPTMAISKIIQTIKSITGREVFIKYVENQGRNYKPLHSEQIRLW
jgi:putative transposase